MLICENASKSDARKLHRWWSRLGRVWFKTAFGRGRHKHRLSVWFER